MTVDPADLEPFWCSPFMRGESLLFIAHDEREAATARLLFPPDGPVTLTSADRTTEFAEGLDYVLDRAAGRVWLPPGSRIPFVTPAQLYPRAGGGDGFMHVRGDPSRLMLAAEGDAFHRLQTAASYAHAPDLWRGYAPTFAGAALPGTRARLAAGAPLAVCLTGDSISEGYNASGFVGVPPWQPPYGALVAAGLEHRYGSPITCRNLAQAGTTSGEGRYLAEDIAAGPPQLVFVAFGMNDAGCLDADDYHSNIQSLLAAIRRAAPVTEFVLVASMLPHPDWHYTVIERFTAYRAVLASLCGPGIVLADMTQLWVDVLSRKSVYDLTGNGINHPNDFGHRLYAQVILSLLVERG